MAAKVNVRRDLFFRWVAAVLDFELGALLLRGFAQGASSYQDARGEGRALEVTVELPSMTIRQEQRCSSPDARNPRW